MNKLQLEEVFKELKDTVASIDEEGYIERKIFEQLVSKDSLEDVENYLQNQNVLIIDECDLLSEKEEDDDDFTFIENCGSDRDRQFEQKILSHKRLSDQEEYELFLVVQCGRQAKALLDQDDFKNEANANIIEELVKRVEEGDKAREKILLSYGRFVFSIAKRYIKAKGEGTKITMLDLYNAGYEGLMTAFDSFDTSKSVKLATYSNFYIKNAIQELTASLRNSVAVPKAAQYERSKIGKYCSEYRKTHEGRNPEYSEIAISLGAKNEAQIKRKATVTIPNLINSSKPAMNLDAPIGDEEDTTFANYVPDINSDPLEELAKEESNKLLYKALEEKLTDLERFIIYKRYGLGNLTSNTTLDILGVEVGLTRERVRQIENEALAKLKNVLSLNLMKAMIRS